MPGHFLSHLLIEECDIGVQISVRPFVRASVRSFVRPSSFTSKFGFLYISDSKECETLHSNCPFKHASNGLFKCHISNTDTYTNTTKYTFDTQPVRLTRHYNLAFCLS